MPKKTANRAMLCALQWSEIRSEDYVPITQPNFIQAFPGEIFL